MARLRRHPARAARSLHPPRHRALARPRRRRPDHVPVPRLAVRRRRRLHADPAARRPDAVSGQGEGRRVRTARSATGCCGSRWTSRATRCRRSPSSRTPSGSSCAPARTPGTPTPARQLENFTDFGHFPWVYPGLRGDPERPVVPDYSVRTEGHVLLYDIVRPEAPNSDDFPVSRQRDADRRARTPQPLPAAPALHDPAAARVGRREGDDLLLQLTARRRGPLRRLRDDRAATTTRTSPTASCRTSRTRSSSRTATSWSPSVPSGCRSTSRPRCT